MRLVVATFGPRVPYVTTRDGVDQGPAGALVQARERARILGDDELISVELVEIDAQNGSTLAVLLAQAASITTKGVSFGLEERVTQRASFDVLRGLGKALQLLHEPGACFG